MNPLLFGHNTDERIVAVHQQSDSTMRVYFREPSGIRHEEAPFFPFFFLADRKPLDGFPRKHWIKHLDGDGFYRYLCAFEEWSTMWEAVRHILGRHNAGTLTKASSHTELDILHLYTDPAAQYLLQTGRTLFKGMRFEDLRRLQVDIETYTTPSYKFSSASRPGDRIILIALSDNTGWKHLIDGKKLEEREMLRELVRIIREQDPDVIEGHNIFNFDLPYIVKRCELNRVPFNIGRDGSTPVVFDTRTSFGERSFEYSITEAAGRHIVDTLILVQAFDMVKRNMESHGLKYAAKYFGISSPDRTYIPGERIAWYWDHEPATLMAYAMDDATETRKLSERLSGSPFYLTRMIPFNYGYVARMGSAAKIESLLVREYLRLKHSIPQPTEGTQTTGGYTDMFVTGVVGPILHVDVESLYPSIMISSDMSPASDVKGIFLQLLKELTSLRLDTKRAMKDATDPAEHSRLDAMQSSFKILINSFYGYLGYARGLFNDFSRADMVTQTGQELLRRMIRHISDRGGTVIEVDTDGIFFVPPASVAKADSVQLFIDELCSAMPPGITVALDGRYTRMLSYKKKNYALLGYDGTLTIKGSSLISRSIERFGRTYLRQCIQLLLKEDFNGLHALYLQYRRDIIEHKLDVQEFARVETLKDPLPLYLDEVKTGKRNKSAPYEVALTLERAADRNTRVSYYITGNDPNPRSFENCKSATAWDPNFPDENTAFYLRRLDEFSAKFKPFFKPGDHRSIFSDEDLFPFDSQGVSLITASTAEDTAEDTFTDESDDSVD